MADELGSIYLSGSIIAKLLIIAFPAAMAAWFTSIGLLSGEGGLPFEDIFATFGPTLAATLLIGFPVSALAFHFSGRKLASSFETYAMAVVLTCVMLVLSSWWLMGRLGVIFLGLPSVAAALTYAVLGWFWILLPMRREHGDV